MRRLVGPAYFKFLNREDVPKVLVDGTVLVRSLEYYRELEAEQWKLIADRLEGASELTMPPRFTVTENSPELALVNDSGVARGLAKQFAAVSSGGRIEMGGAIFIRTVPGHIYCASHGHFDELWRYHTQEAELKYDACLRISSLRRLCRRIFRTGVIVETGVPFAELFKGAAVEPVQYESRSRSIEHGTIPEESPFKKALLYQHQHESRIYFAPADGLVPDASLVVKIEDPASIFTEMPLP